MISVSTYRGLRREVRLSKVGLHYLKHWFLIDALAVIPWDLIGPGHGGHHGEVVGLGFRVEGKGCRV